MNIRQSVADLRENFTELEADLDPTVYRALEPHIRNISEQYANSTRKMERIGRITRMVALLLKDERVDVPETGLVELESILEADPDFHTTSWNLRVHVLASERTDTQTAEQEGDGAAMPVRPTAGRVDAVRPTRGANPVRMTMDEVQITAADFDRVVRVDPNSRWNIAQGNR